MNQEPSAEKREGVPPGLDGSRTLADGLWLTLSTVNLPNALSLLRIFLVPFLVVVLLTKFEGREIVALAIFLVATATDFFDGGGRSRRSARCSIRSPTSS